MLFTCTRSCARANDGKMFAVGMLNAILTKFNVLIVFSEDYPPSKLVSY